MTEGRQTGRKLVPETTIATVDALISSPYGTPLEWLSEPERTRYTRFTVPKRQTEWLAGRLAARRVIRRLFKLSGLGQPHGSEITIRTHTDGSPAVTCPSPLRIAISISHGHGYAAAAATHLPGQTGIDLEMVIPRRPEWRDSFMTAGEKDRFAGQALMETAIWSAKEAIFKTLRPEPDFDPVNIEILAVPRLSTIWQPLVPARSGLPENLSIHARIHDNLVIAVTSQENHGDN